MKGNPKVIEAMNGALAKELTAISQYMVHAEMFDNWGYDKLHAHAEQTAKAEMKHAATLISRVLFLEGRPVVDALAPFHIGAEPPEMIANDLAGEADAVATYNALIKIAVDAGDNTTRSMAEAILREEDDHLNYAEAQVEQIKTVGLAPFLTEMIG